MKFSTALKFLVAFEALRAMYIRFGVLAQSIIVDRTSENNGDVIYSTNLADAVDVLLNVVYKTRTSILVNSS